MKILSVSDVEIGLIYSPHLVDHFTDVDLLISCGDLPYFYLEYMISMLNKPLYHVLGNHVHAVEFGSGEDRHTAWGAIDLHGRTMHYEGLLMAGLQGSIQYNYGPNQYSQAAMWQQVLMLVPGLLINRLRYGRYLDLFVTHSPPWGVHDKSDRPHQGFKAFRWFLKVFKPSYHLHGHIHIYRNDTIRKTRLFDTEVINTYGYRVTDIDLAEITQRANDEKRRVRTSV